MNGMVLPMVSRLVCVGCTFCLCLFSAERRRPSSCDWSVYRPIKFGTPIVGGYDRLATVKVMPTYPQDARREGVRGTVTSEVLVDRTGNVVKTCSRGEPLLVNAVDDALMKWRFAEDFGIDSEHPRRGRRFAVLSLTFYFDPDSGVENSRGKTGETPPVPR